MEKINVTINVAKISKDKIVERKYTNKEGVEVVTKDYKIDIVPTREIKVVAQGDTWIMKKTHFVAESQTKEERANKVKATFRAALNKHKGDSQAAKKEIYAGQAKEKADKAKSAKNESYGPGHDAGMKASKGAKNNREQISSYLKARKAKEGRAKGSLADVKTGTVGTTRASKGNPKS